MKLRAESILIAQDLQESADALTAGDTHKALSDAVDQMTKDGGYGYVLDHMGDDESGDVVYRSSGETMQAPYSISGGNGFAKKAAIDTANAMKVRGRMVYEPTMDEGDHIAGMTEALKTAKIYTELPVYERFISKPERDAASEGDFAGKGKSFPILKREDVMAAVRSIGRAGSGNSSASEIKANIIAIAKRKGWTDELPKAWKTKATESATGPAAGVKLIESAVSSFVDELKLAESRSSYPILMISPGTGSSAHYPAGVLKKAAEAGVFKAKTFMYWNHPTAAQEAARPEGDLDNLAAITTKDGVWMENGPKGPGVYAEAKPMADYAQKIEERAPHIGLSIRAGGTASGRMVNGKPELASIDHVESVDYVTKAGRGGMPLAESSRFTKLLEEFNFTEGGEVTMTDAEVKKLQESVAALEADNVKMKGRIMFTDAASLAGAVLSTTSLNEAQRAFVMGSVIGTVESPREIPVKDGALNATALTEAINAGAKAYSATLPTSGGVRGMGTAPVVMTETAEAKAAREARQKESAAQDVEALVVLGMSEADAKKQVGVAA